MPKNKQEDALNDSIFAIGLITIILSSIIILVGFITGNDFIAIHIEETVGVRNTAQLLIMIWAGIWIINYYK